MLLEQRTSSRENWRWTGVLIPLLCPGYKEWDEGLAGHLLIGWGTCTGWWGKSRANTFSLWGRRGDRLYCSINSYDMGEGRTIRVWFFCSCIPRPSLVLSALSSLGHHTDHIFLIPQIRRTPQPYNAQKRPLGGQRGVLSRDVLPMGFCNRIHLG